MIITSPVVRIHISVKVQIWTQTSSQLFVPPSCHNEDTHHIGCGSGGADHHQGRTKDLTLGILPNGNLIRGHFMHRKYVSLLVRNWFIWTVILGSHSRPQLIGALGKEVQDKFLIVFHFYCTASVADICSWVLRYVG